MLPDPAHFRRTTLILLALPASGKSELRRYLASVNADIAAADFGLGLGPTVQLDDYPYVHLMRKVGEEMRRIGGSPVFFASDREPFLEGGDWATLIELVNEDYAALGTEPPIPSAPTLWLLDRFDRARRVVGMDAPFENLSDIARSSLAAALDREITEFAGELSATLASYEPGVSTVVIEFARGGPEGAEPPLPDPHGYAFSLRHLFPEVLGRAAAVYVWVTPQERRRRNRDRTVPGIAGNASILHHGVPEVVMRGGAFAIPAAVFDNRIDHTSFLRADQSEWDPRLVEVLHTALTNSFAQLKAS